MNNYFVTYAQNREDLIIASFFDDIDTGFYIDVGAHHPVFDSVTKHFYNKGWYGINIEPIKKYHGLLCADRPRDINLNIGIGSKAGTLNLREYISEAGEGLSTFSESMKKKYEHKKHWATGNFEEYGVEIKTLDDICTKYVPRGTKISFLKIDVEGLEYDVLKGLNLEIHRPRVMCIESNHIVNDWSEILLDKDYCLVFQDGINDYYIDNKKNKGNYDYAEKCLLRYPKIIRWEEMSELLYLSNKVELQERILSDTVSLDDTKHQSEKTTVKSLKETIHNFIIDIDSWMLLNKVNQKPIRLIKSNIKNQTLLNLVKNYNKKQRSQFKYCIASLYIAMRKTIKYITYIGRGYA